MKRGGIGRRHFVGLLGATAAAPAWPVPRVRAQQQDGRVRRVGVLMATAEGDPIGQERIRTFRRGLSDLGWIEGRNVRFDVRWAGNVTAQEQRYARELVEIGSDVILANGTPATLALRMATRTIPIVFGGISDPVGTGVVANMARPDANVTGF